MWRLYSVSYFFLILFLLLVLFPFLFPLFVFLLFLLPCSTGSRLPCVLNQTMAYSVNVQVQISVSCSWNVPCSRHWVAFSLFFFFFGSRPLHCTLSGCQERHAATRCTTTRSGREISDGNEWSKVRRGVLGVVQTLYLVREDYGVTVNIPNKHRYSPSRKWGTCDISAYCSRLYLALKL